jgi:hypothetical protein
VGKIGGHGWRKGSAVSFLNDVSTLWKGRMLRDSRLKLDVRREIGAIRFADQFTHENNIGE